ncbi:MAG TPA: class I SAM-dependent methyltransferase [Steroidobacteraceae bacterium]|nr:class I SAM-dependent methyltransferase [Steroidobacteraceae bacterium]
MPDLMYDDPRLAALYDRLYPPSPGSLGFYLPMIMAAQSVLDVGCGTGALLAAAREAGYAGQLCGLDPAEGMLALARAHADIAWIRGAARALARRGEFDLIVMTGHAFQVLVEDEELRATLAALRAALRGGGRFAFETRNPAARAWEEWTPDREVQVTDAQGDIVTVSLEVEAPFDGRRVAFAQTYSCASWGGPLVSRSALRFLDAAGLARFLSETGFAIEAQYGDFDRRPLAPDSREIVTIARAL